jgi:4-alpha-glucanotransferase
MEATMTYLHGDKRLCGVALPLAALRSAGGWRVGEYPDLVEFSALCADAGIGLIQLLPLNDTGGQSSPYFALSAFALHPLYLRVRDLPEAGLAPEALKALESFALKAKPGERFPYQQALDAKLAALRAVYDAAAGLLKNDTAIDAFIAEHPWVKGYAVYKRLKSANRERSWQEWSDYRDPSAKDIETLWNDPGLSLDHRFQVWIQLRCAEQFSAASRALAARGIELLGDLPILMNEDSADVWADRLSFRLDLRAGSPPDGGSPLGQNWGFPIYDWERMAKDGYAFWKNRLREADAYYSSYRIDHVLGFFRLWALPEREESGYMGRFLPGLTMSAGELNSLGFSDERVRWLSEPHIGGDELKAYSGWEGVLDRIGDEELYLFKRSVRGERDISAAGLEAPLAERLKERWRDRTLVPLADGRYVPSWRYSSTRAWASLSDHERELLGGRFGRMRAEDQRGWLEQGRLLLGMLKAESAMLPCAEDLGSIPPGVPETLAELGMLGLRLPRWTRLWEQAGQPYVALERYPELSVCTPSVHDTSTLRGWWELEDGREGFAAAYCPTLSATGPSLSAEGQYTLLKALAGAASRLYVLQLQDLLDMDERYRSADPVQDRVNVPGAVADFNWTWRMGPSVQDLAANGAWLDALRGLVKARGIKG